MLNESDFSEKKKEEHTDELVFVELITHIVESQRANPGGVVFKLADLWSLYEKRLRESSPSSVDVN